MSESSLSKKLGAISTGNSEGLKKRKERDKNNLRPDLRSILTLFMIKKIADICKSVYYDGFELKVTNITEFSEKIFACK